MTFFPCLHIFLFCFAVAVLAEELPGSAISAGERFLVNVFLSFGGEDNLNS